MPKRKKYPRLPNGYGSIRYLGKGRRNPFAVHPPVKDYDDEGRALRPPALCYVDTWMKGFAILTAYKAGNYVPGMEKDLQMENGMNADALSNRILSDYNQSRRTTGEKSITFAEVYKEFYDWKFNSEKEYSHSAKASTIAAYKNAAVLHDRIFKDLRHDDLQQVINDCPLKHSSLELIVSLFKQMASSSSCLAGSPLSKPYPASIFELNKGNGCLTM